MPNGKPGDHPLTDFVVHGMHPFPPDIEEMLRRIDVLGRAAGRWPLGEKFAIFDAGARRDLAHLISMLEAGRGDEVLVDPRTGKCGGHRTKR